MRSADMQPGQDYILHGERRRIVTVLETPEEIRRQAKVRVRFVNGVKAGELADLPSRRVAAPLNAASPGAPRPRGRA